MTNIVTWYSWYGIRSVISRCYHEYVSILAKTFLHSRTFYNLLFLVGLFAFFYLITFPQHSLVKITTIKKLKKIRTFKLIRLKLDFRSCGVLGFLSFGLFVFCLLSFFPSVFLSFCLFVTISHGCSFREILHQNHNISRFQIL